MNFGITRTLQLLLLTWIYLIPAAAGSSQKRAISFSVCELPKASMTTACGNFYYKKTPDFRNAVYVFATSPDLNTMAICLDGIVYNLRSLNSKGTKFSDGKITVSLVLVYDQLPDPIPNEMESAGVEGNMIVKFKKRTVVLKIQGHEGC